MALAINDMDQSLFIACAAAIALIVLKPWDEFLAQHRALRPLMSCGTMCYSLYLMHWPLVGIIVFGLIRLGVSGNALTLFVTLPLCMAVAITVAWLFHTLVERRFLNPSASPVKRIPMPEPAQLGAIS